MPLADAWGDRRILDPRQYMHERYRYSSAQITMAGAHRFSTLVGGSFFWRPFRCYWPVGRVLVALNTRFRRSGAVSARFSRIAFRGLQAHHRLKPAGKAAPQDMDTIKR
jgi:hypothetical protein